jgi:hypothetical protein
MTPCLHGETPQQVKRTGMLRIRGKDLPAQALGPFRPALPVLPQRFRKQPVRLLPAPRLRHLGLAALLVFAPAAARTRIVPPGFHARDILHVTASSDAGRLLRRRSFSPNTVHSSWL